MQESPDEIAEGAMHRAIAAIPDDGPEPDPNDPVEAIALAVNAGLWEEGEPAIQAIRRGVRAGLAGILGRDWHLVRFTTKPNGEQWTADYVIGVAEEWTP